MLAKFVSILYHLIVKHVKLHDMIVRDLRGKEGIFLIWDYYKHEHGGEISVESKAGEETTFSVRLGRIE